MSIISFTVINKDIISSNLLYWSPQTQCVGFLASWQHLSSASSPSASQFSTNNTFVYMHTAPTVLVLIFV